ncbi:hypothetical protein DFH09DRAFT_1308885 [Mycena vulgaris]|nr:hypothetical protein DFH09DRAFT_1308885 [Mycena vulgaris]
MSTRAHLMPTSHPATFLALPPLTYSPPLKPQPASVVLTLSESSAALDDAQPRGREFRLPLHRYATESVAGQRAMQPCPRRTTLPHRRATLTLPGSGFAHILASSSPPFYFTFGIAERPRKPLDNVERAIPSIASAMSSLAGVSLTCASAARTPAQWP